VRGSQVLQLAMCIGTALLGVLLLLMASSSELSLFGWLFVVLGGLGALLSFFVPTTTRR
jgi:hypothetical protein